MYWLPWFAGIPYSGRRACNLFAYCLHVMIAMVCRRSVQWQKGMWSICPLSTCTDCHGLQAFRTVAEEHVIYLPIVYMYWLPWFAGVPYSGRRACDLFAYCLHVLIAMVCKRSVQWQKSMWSICPLSTCTDCHGLQAFRTVAEEHVKAAEQRGGDCDLEPLRSQGNIIFSQYLADKVIILILTLFQKFIADWLL